MKGKRAWVVRNSDAESINIAGRTSAQKNTEKL
jgi:hypothetical protein